MTTPPHSPETAQQSIMPGYQPRSTRHTPPLLNRLFPTSLPKTDRDFSLAIAKTDSTLRTLSTTNPMDKLEPTPLMNFSTAVVFSPHRALAVGGPATP
jgi:hypothetical protein